MSEPVTIERLERALALCAYLVVLDGPVAIPWFERIERDLALLKAEQNTIHRAKQLLESYRNRGVAGPYVGTDPPAYMERGGLKAIR